MTTVACVFVRGHVRFTPEYVERLAAMVKRWMDRPYRFVCLTDQPRKMPKGVVPIEIKSPHPMYGWWAKMRLWDESIGLNGRILYLDLDTLVVASLSPILDFPARFALLPDGAPDWQPKNRSRVVVKRFNSSVMVWDAGCQEARQLWESWSPAVAARLWGDQDHAAEQIPDAATLPAIWFPRFSELKSGPTPEARVVLVKKPKNIEAAKKHQWFADAWRAA